MQEMRILSPTGVCGSGFVESSFEKALAQKPHVIGCDAGSTDPGPGLSGLGTNGVSQGSDPPRPAADAARRAAPEDTAPDRLRGHRRQRRPARGHAPARQGNRRGRRLELQARADPLRAGQGLPEKTAARRPHQAALAGAAFRRGDDRPQRAHRRHDGRRAVHPRAAGRRGRRHRRARERHRDLRRDAGACTAFPRASPGTPRRYSNAARRRWSSARRRTACSPGCARITSWSRRRTPSSRCTPQSIASHSLYENADPFRLVECSGTLDLTHSQLRSADRRAR